MATTPQRATKLLVPLFANGDCYATDSLVEHIGPTLAPAIAELVANAAMPCYLKAGCATRDGACRQELLDRISKR